MMRTSNAPRVVLVAALLAAPMSGAQPEAPSHVEAFVRMRQASVARGRNDLVESARLYREALELGAPPQCLRDLATVLEAQNRWREAAGLWTRYSALASTEAERRAALERRESLRGMLTALRVRVVPPMAARVARVWFDRDTPRWYQTGGLEQVADGGRHRVRVEAEGYEPWEMMVPTAFGEAVQVVAVMRPRAVDAGLR